MPSINLLRINAKNPCLAMGVDFLPQFYGDCTKEMEGFGRAGMGVNTGLTA
jgi:hypothetical protein